MYDTRFVLDYYRLTADKRLLFGGGANYSGKESRDIAAELRPAIERTFPALDEETLVQIFEAPEFGAALLAAVPL